MAAPAGRAWYLVALLCLLGVMSYMDRLALGLLIDPIRTDLNINDAHAGLLMGPAFALFYASMALPVAWAIDRGNRKWILAAGVMLWSISTSAAAFAPDFETLFMLRMGVGIGEAVLSPAAVSMIGDLFVRERRPTPMAAMLASQSAGAGASLVIVAAILAALSAGTLDLPPFLADLAPWRLTLFLIGLPGMLLSVILVVTAREPSRGRLVEGAAIPTRVEETGAFPSKRAAARFFFLFLLGGNLASTPLYIAAMWFPTHLIRTFGVTAETVGLFYGMVALVAGGVGALGLSATAERVALRGRKNALLLISMAAIPVILLLFLGSLHAATFLLALIAAGMFQLLGSGVGAIPSVVIAALASGRMRGRLAAVHLLFQAVLPSSIAPYLVGYLSDTTFNGQVGMGMTMIGLFCYPAALLCFLGCRRAYDDAVYGRARPAAMVPAAV